MQALGAFVKAFPSHRTAEIQSTLQKGAVTSLGVVLWSRVCLARDFIIHKQEKDGSWYGCWGVCFTYATWFGLGALAIINESYDNSEPVRRACSFLLEHQRSDGGWGESYLSCQNKVFFSFSRISPGAA